MARDAGQSLYVENGKTIRNINLHFAPFKKGTWRTITHFDGLANNHVLAVHQGPDGMMWFELDHLRHEMGKKYEFQNIIGSSLAIMKVRALMERAIDSELTVLITGETGTGKELVAWTIHHK